MDSNSSEKKPKRPRIGQAFRASEDSGESRPRFETSNFTPHTQEDGEQQNDGYRKRPFRPYNNGGQQRPYGNNRPYNSGNSYQRPYAPRPQRPDYEAGTDENPSETPVQDNHGYTPRPHNNYNNGGQRQYNNGPRQYNNNRPYNNGGQQRPYGNNRPYNNGGQQRPYGNNRPYNNGGQQRPYGNNRPYNNGGQQRPYGNNRPYNNNRQYNNNNGGAFPGRGKSFTPRPKRVEYEVEIPDPNEQIRLNKYMSNAGICSRREADEFIQQGLVKVNGTVVTELGTKITHSDVVEYDEKVVTLQSKCYILLNKPKDCVTTSDDPHGRTTVLDLVKGACNERIYPVGRLDRNTTGVLLLTNDGDLASKLTHPKFVKKKIYHVWCDRDITEDDMQRIADGIELDDGPIHADAISYATETDRNQAGIEIHSGRNRIVRRIFESLGYHVTKLDRVYFAGLTKKNLPRGRWRYLTQEEVNYLKMGSFE